VPSEGAIGAHDDVPAAALVEIAIPVYNEEEILESSVRKLRSYLDHSFPFAAEIVIVDNASVDRTWEIASALVKELPGVSAIHLDQKGKGRAVRAAWTASRAEVVAYMDADLSTDLDGLLPLVAPLLSGHSHVAIGSRIAPGARVLRGAKREFISRGYNLMLRATLRNRFSDAQCGFKAMRRDQVDLLLPLIEDEHWFFDTELLMHAEREGLRIHEVPVDWVDDPDSRVNIGGAMRDDLKGVWRLSRLRLGRKPAAASNERTHQMARYASVGLASTLAYLVLFLFLRGTFGMLVANVIAAATISVLNTIAHVLFTFSPEHRGRKRDAFAVGATSFAIGIGLTSLTLVAASTLGWTSSAAEVMAIVVGSIAASAIRFILLRGWAYRTHVRSVRTGVVPAGDDATGTVPAAA